MAGGLAQAEAIRLVNYMLGTASTTATSLPVQVRLITNAVGSPPTATAAGTELSGNVRVNLVTSSSSPMTAAAASGTGAAATNSFSALTFANLAAGTVNFIEIWDNTPLRKMWGPLGTPRTVLAGDSLVFSTSQIVASLGV